MAIKPTQTHRNAGGIDYTLTRKGVKNINLRVRTDGSVAVSANTRVSLKAIDNFVANSAPQILNVQAKLRNHPHALTEITPAQQQDMAQAFLPIATEVTRQVHLHFQKYNLPLPELRLRYMKSQWGSCYTTRNIIVLNTRLLDYPVACTAFVVTHEFCHFIHPDHSPNFYALMDEIMPDWRDRKAVLL